jgi:hypothetical protein
MGEVEAAGRTVVFVSHDLTAIGQLCSRSIWLDGGRVVADGPSREVIDRYLAMALPVDSAPRTSFEGGRVLVHGVSTTNAAGQPAAALQRDQPFTIDVDLSVLADGAPIDVALYVMTGRGIRVLDEAWSDTSEDRPSAAGRYHVRMGVPAVLNAGSYSVGIWCGTSFEQYVDEPSAATFSLEGSVMDRPDRLVVLELPWQATSVDDAIDV